MIRKPINVPLTEARIQELQDEIEAAKEQLDISKDVEGLYCAVWSAARSVISNNTLILLREYEMKIIEVEDE